MGKVNSRERISTGIKPGKKEASSRKSRERGGEEMKKAKKNTRSQDTEGAARFHLDGRVENPPKKASSTPVARITAVTARRSRSSFAAACCQRYTKGCGKRVSLLNWRSTGKPKTSCPEHETQPLVRALSIRCTAA